MHYYLNFDFMQLLMILGSIGSTFIVAWFIGFERQNSGKSAGISAHVLVALGACAAGILQQYMYFDSIASLKESGVVQTIENQRIIAQVIAGIGFIGAGVIMKSEKHIVGLTTATTLWVSCIIGLLFGSGYLIQGAIIGFVVVVFMYLRDVIRHINPFKRFPPYKDPRDIEEASKKDI